MNTRVFDRFPVLSTPRCVLREPVLEDAPALLALHGDEPINRFQAQEALADLDAARALVTRWRRRFTLKGEIRWAITAREDGALPGTLPGTLIGTCAFLHFAHHRGQVTYEVARPAWGRGLATEVVRALVAFGQGEAELNRVEAMVLPGNEASARVLLKAGFAEEGLLRGYACWKGAYRSLRMFSIVQHA